MIYHIVHICSVSPQNGWSIVFSNQQDNCRDAVTSENTKQTWEEIQRTYLEKWSPKYFCHLLMMRPRIRHLTLSRWPCQKRKCKMEKEKKSKAHTMTNPSMQKLWEIFHLLLRHQRRRMSSTAVHPSMEFLMQLLVVGLFLVLLLYLYLAFTTINFLLWLCTLQVLKDLNPNSAGLFCRNVCQLVSSDGLPHPLRRWHRQTAPILDKYFCKVHDSLWKSSCRLSSSPAQDLVASKITC